MTILDVDVPQDGDSRSALRKPMDLDVDVLRMLMHEPPIQRRQTNEHGACFSAARYAARNLVYTCTRDLGIKVCSN